MLLGSVPGWPLWPDVGDELPLLAEGHRIGILSNVDDDVFARSRVAALVADDAVLTSERLRAYKPHAEIYRRARERAGGALLHVATSARDVGGALAAGIDVVRLRRPGHRLDASGPAPAHEAADLAELRHLLDHRRSGPSGDRRARFSRRTPAVPRSRCAGARGRPPRPRPGPAGDRADDGEVPG